MIRLIKEFFASPEQLAGPGTKLPALTRDEASALTAESMLAEGPSREIEVTTVEKFNTEPDGRAPVDYHLVTIQVDGSQEHRVVLANGVVLKPRLRPVSEK